MTDRHSKHSQYTHDFILGFADGLTVPFALTAGLSSLGSSRLVIIAGLAELFSGSISMGAGAYLAAIADRQHYDAEIPRQRKRILDAPNTEREEIIHILCAYGPERQYAQPFVDALCKDEDQMIQFMLKLELKLEKPRRREAYISAIVMAFAYLIGGLLPMIPYFATKNANTALFISIGVTASVLLAFGYLKARIFECTLGQGIESALKTLLVGAIAAGSSYGIVRATAVPQHTLVSRGSRPPGFSGW